MDMPTYALLRKKIGTGTVEAVSDYLGEHLTNPTNPPIDNSLTIENAAADAKEVGKRFTDLKSGLSDIAVLSRNVYNPQHEQLNTNLGSGGVETYNANYKINTEYIPIEYGDYVSFYGNSSTDYDGIQNYCLYDENKTFIKRDNFTDLGLVSKQVDGVGAKYIRFSLGKNATDVMVVIDATQPLYSTLPYVAYGVRIKYDALPEEVKNTTEVVGLLDYDYKYTDLTDVLEEYTSAYINSSGVIVNSTSWTAQILKMDEIPSFSEISIKSYCNVSGRYQIAFYSSSTPTDATFIYGEKFAVSELNETIITEIPANAVSMLITNLIASGSISVIVKSAEKESTVDQLETDMNALDVLYLKEQRSKFDRQFNYIAYSAMMQSGKGPNSEEQYLWGAQKKFTSIKGDVRISSDNEIIMCHDEGFTLNASGEVTTYDAQNSTKIRNMTAAQCYALVYEGTTDHVCGIDALIRTCKLYGKIAFVTVRSSYLDDIFPKLFASLDKYYMRERTIINGFSYETMKKARKYDKNIMLSWVQNKNHQITTSDVDKADSLGNCLITCYDYSGVDETKATNQSNTVLTYAQSKGIRVYEAIIGYDADLNNSVLFDRGFTGAQLAFEPEMFSLLS